MASDAVHKVLEDMVPAMEYFIARKVFSKDEVKDIVKKRTDTEYLLQGPNAGYEEVLQSITYEKGLEEIRRKRSKGVQLKQHKHNDHIIERITKIYDRFGEFMSGEDRIQLNYSQLEFLSKQKGKSYDRRCSQILGKLILEHPGREDIWVHAARWEMERHHSIDNSRDILQRALRLTPTGLRIWKAYFLIELTYWGELLSAFDDAEDKEDASKKPEMSVLLSGEIPKIVHKHAMKSISDPLLRRDITIEFIRISLMFEHTGEILTYLRSYIQDVIQQETPSASVTAIQVAMPFLVSESGIENEKKNDDTPESILKLLLKNNTLTIEELFLVCDEVSAAIFPTEQDKKKSFLEISLSGENIETASYHVCKQALLEKVKSAKYWKALSQTTQKTPLIWTIKFLSKSGEDTSLQQLFKQLSSVAASDVDIMLLRLETDKSGESLKQALSSIKFGSDTNPQCWKIFVKGICLYYNKKEMLSELIKKAIATTAALQTGPGRVEALTGVARIALVADPITSMDSLQTVSKIPETVAAQLVSAALGSCQSEQTSVIDLIKRRKISSKSDPKTNKIRQLFDRLLRGPAGLGSSALLWALWIDWERKIDPTCTARMTQMATRKPGGVLASDLHQQLALLA